MLSIEGYLPAGSYTTSDTLDVMLNYARKDSQAIADLAMDIVAHVDDTRSSIIAIRNWILSNLRFVKDSQESKRLFGINAEQMEGGDLEMVKSPLAVIESGTYDCDCCATLAGSMFLALGIPARLMAVSFIEASPEEDTYSHVFVQAFDGEEWITVDPVSYPHERTMMMRDVKAHLVRNL